MKQSLFALFSLRVFLSMNSNYVESKICGASNCTMKCCFGSNVYSLCRSTCEGIICMYNENCDGGYCCASQCVNNSLACQRLLNISPSQAKHSVDGKKNGHFATWEFALIVLASVIAGFLLCLLLIWGCRTIISKIWCGTTVLLYFTFWSFLVRMLTLKTIKTFVVGGDSV